MIWKEYNGYIISEDGRISTKGLKKRDNKTYEYFNMIRDPKEFFCIKGKRVRKKGLLKKLFKDG